MRVMGLDYGQSTVGVAISDRMGLTAQPVETIRRNGENKLRRTYARLRELIGEYEVERIVVGLPKHMNGEIGDRAERSMEFAKELEQKVGLPVDLWDERMTTVAATQVLEEGGVRRENRKEYVDKLAASLILQGFLDFWEKNNGAGDDHSDR
ncbi:MAG: Holliday junction resolvase RuvX [Eubacterium sp.]|nr:Holliday junction resolvase RuvX [Eubacterium sp.]